MRVATFYPNGTINLHSLLHSYARTKEAIDAGLDIFTTQMCMLNHVKDYDQIDIDYNENFHDIDASRIVTITNNHDGTYSCDRTDKEIRVAHNLFSLWENGGLDA